MNYDAAKITKETFRSRQSSKERESALDPLTAKSVLVTSMKLSSTPTFVEDTSLNPITEFTARNKSQLANNTFIKNYGRYGNPQLGKNNSKADLCSSTKAKQTREETESENPCSEYSQKGKIRVYP